MLTLFKGLISSHDGDFYCFHCFHSFRTENKLKKHENASKNHVYYYIEIPEEDDKILNYNHGEKSMNVPFIINADMECLLEWIDMFHNNSKKSSATKITKTLDSGYSLLHIAQLMHQKINLIIIEVKTAWKKLWRLKKACNKNN